MSVSFSVLVKHTTLCHTVSFTVSFSVIVISQKKTKNFQVSGKLVVSDIQSEREEKNLCLFVFFLFFSVVICINEISYSTVKTLRDGSYI